MEIRVTTDVTTEPVTLAEIKSWCQIDADYAAEDDAILLIAKGARERLEKELNLSFATKTILCQWSGNSMFIPYGPVQLITGVTSSTDLATAIDYNEYGLDFPTISLGADDCYIIYPVGYLGARLYNLTYVAGYETLPSALKQALLIQIDYELKGRGMPSVDLSPDALRKSAIYSRNLAIQN